MWVWASHLFSLDLQFLACKIEKSSEASSGPFQVQYSMVCSPPTRSFWRKKNSHANQKAAWSDGISDTVLLLGEIERLKAEGISCSQSVQQACEESMLRPGGENSFWLPGTLVLMAEKTFKDNDRVESCVLQKETAQDNAYKPEYLKPSRVSGMASQRPWQASWSKKDKGRGLTERKGWVGLSSRLRKS